MGASGCAVAPEPGAGAAGPTGAVEMPGDGSAELAPSVAGPSGALQLLDESGADVAAGTGDEGRAAGRQKKRSPEEAAGGLLGKMAEKAASSKKKKKTETTTSPKTKDKYPEAPKPGDVVTYMGATVTSKPQQRKFRVFVAAAVAKKLGLPKAIDCDRQWGDDAQKAFEGCIDKIRALNTKSG